MTNAPFADFQRGDIVGIWSPEEQTLRNKFLITETREGKFFGFVDTSSTNAAYRFKGDLVELQKPNQYVKECSVKLNEDVNPNRL